MPAAAPAGWRSLAPRPGLAAAGVVSGKFSLHVIEPQPAWQPSESLATETAPAGPRLSRSDTQYHRRRAAARLPGPSPLHSDGAAAWGPRASPPVSGLSPRLLRRVTVQPQAVRPTPGPDHSPRPTGRPQSGFRVGPRSSGTVAIAASLRLHSLKLGPSSGFNQHVGRYPGRAAVPRQFSVVRDGSPVRPRRGNARRAGQRHRHASLTDDCK